jgi:hypothetical protein
MIDLFLLIAALAIGQATRADRATAAAGPALLPAPSPSSVMSALPDDKVAPATGLSPAAGGPAATEDNTAPPPAAESAAPEPNLVTITAPLLPIPIPPPTPAGAAAAVPPDRWALQRILQGTYLGDCMDTERIAVYGWVESSYTFSSVPNNNLPEGFNYRANEPIMQQLWTRINRSVVTSGTSEPTFGFNVDLLYGTDYRFTLQRALWNKQLTDRHGLPAIYGFDPVQFYVESYFPTICGGLDVKIGRFYTPYGVDSVEAPTTPLMSHSYTFANGGPFTHTGILLTQNLPCNLIAQFGLVLGEDLFIDPADEPTGIFSLQYTQPGNRNIVKFTTIFDSGRFNQHQGFSGIPGNPNYEIANVVWTHNFDSVPRLTNNLVCLYGYMYNIPDIGRADWFGIVNYVQYTFSPELVGTVRLEAFDDPQGIRTNTYPGAAPDNAKGLYTSLTLGVNYKPRRQPSGKGTIMFRPEIRYDYNWDSKPFDNSHHGLFTVGSDVIVRW